MRAAVVGVALAVILAGCGSGGAGGAGSSVAAVPPTLPSTAVAYLPSRHTRLTAAFLVRESQTPSLAGKLRGWGFVAGAHRYFQGESKRLQVVDSRTLRFRRATGASAYVAFMRSHLGPVLGPFPRIQDFAAGPRHGILAVGQECQCHLANPSLLAVVARGPIVSWLEINGPGATQRRLVALIDRAP